MARMKCFDGTYQARLTCVALGTATNCSSLDMAASLSAANADTLHTYPTDSQQHAQDTQEIQPMVSALCTQVIETNARDGIQHSTSMITVECLYPAHLKGEVRKPGSKYAKLATPDLAASQKRASARDSCVSWLLLA